MKKSVRNSEKYSWGDACLGWRLADFTDLSVIEEEMPPGAEERLHVHEKARQFFYILEGKAGFELDGSVHEVHVNEGFHIQPGAVHRIRNISSVNLRFLVISAPPTKADRINL